MTMRRQFLLLAVLLLLLGPCQTWAAVTFDSTFEKGQTATATSFAFCSSGTSCSAGVAPTVAGSVGNNSNRVLICAAGFDHTAVNLGTVTMTWNSVSMTAITSTDTPTGARSIYAFGLINPATGAQTIQVNWTNSVNTSVALGCVSTFNADQATGWSNGGTDSNSTCTPSSNCATSTVTTTTGGLAVVGHVNDNSSSTAIGTGTSAWVETTLNANYAQGHRADNAGSTVVAWTLGSSVAWANAKVNVIQAAGVAAPLRRPAGDLTGIGGGGRFFKDPLQ